MPKLTLVLERKPVQVYDVGSFVTNIGRAEDMHIVIDNVSVSRRQSAPPTAPSSTASA